MLEILRFLLLLLLRLLYYRTENLCHKNDSLFIYFWVHSSTKYNWSFSSYQEKRELENRFLVRIQTTSRFWGRLLSELLISISRQITGI
jgi:hypothetical protein